LRGLKYFKFSQKKFKVAVVETQVSQLLVEKTLQELKML
jgi:hypothetical protein